jgi:long-chain acyl-CoA synthetase
MTMDTSAHSNLYMGKAPGSYLPDSLNPHGYQSLTDVLALATKNFLQIDRLLRVLVKPLLIVS